MFKGTARRTALRRQPRVRRNGRRLQRLHHRGEHRLLRRRAAGVPAALLDLLGDMLRPALRQEDFDIEKNVILEEIALYEDQPQLPRVREADGRALRAATRWATACWARAESITALTRQDMQDYFDRRYCPGNVTVVGVGNLDWPAAGGQGRTDVLALAAVRRRRATLPPAAARGSGRERSSTPRSRGSTSG